MKYQKPSWSTKGKLIVAVTLLFVLSCTTLENKPDSDKADTLKTNTLPSCKEIKPYPLRFSYASDSFKQNLLNQLRKPLTTFQREVLFIFDKEDKYVPYEIYDTDYEYFNNYDVFAVGQISYKTAMLIIYLVKRKDEYSEDDQLVLVLYNKNGKPYDILSKVLEDAYGSTYEMEFSSRNNFVIINTDNEYSPDPESEAEDIISGRIIEPVISTQYYHIDTLHLKFNTP